MTLVLHELEAWQGIGFTLPLHRAMHISQYSCILRHVQRSLGIMLMLIVFASAGPSGGGSMHGFGMSGPATGAVWGSCNHSGLWAGHCNGAGHVGLRAGHRAILRRTFRVWRLWGRSVWRAEQRRALRCQCCVNKHPEHHACRALRRASPLVPKAAQRLEGWGVLRLLSALSPPSTGTWVSLFLGF